MINLRLLIAAIAICLLPSTIAHSQIPEDAENLQISVTITLDHVLNTMEDAERFEFQEMRLKMRKNKASQKKLADDPDSLALLEARFEQLETEFEEAFGAYRGLRHQTVTLWGNPSPDLQRILTDVVDQRFSGNGDGALYSHWYINENGFLIGSPLPPTFESEPEIELEIEPSTAVNRSTVSSRDTSCEAQAGPPPENWNYEAYGPPKCKCVDGAFGIDSCWWYKD